jgi:hypothetical protein
MNHIVTHGTDEELLAVSQHRCEIAFTDLVIGDPGCKIYGALPTDTMHALRICTMGRVVQLIFDCTTPKQKYNLDKLAQSFHKQHRQTGRKFFPKTDFSNGVSSLSNITASERCGQVFLLVCLSQFEEGWRILNQALLSKGCNTNLGEVLETLEAICCFDAWTRLDKFWHHSDQEQLADQAKESLAQLLLMVCNCLPRENGNGWKVPTFHNLMHIVSDMCKYGKPKESNTEVGEKNHKVFAKRIGRRCRKQHKTFAKQASSRLSEAFIIEKMASLMGLMDEFNFEKTDSPELVIGNNDTECAQGTHFIIQHNGDKVEAIWQSVTEEHLLTSDQDVLDYLLSHFSMNEDNVISVHCCTEYQYKSVLIRSHPCYKGEGPWFDWVNVNLEEITINEVIFPGGMYPCKVLAIVPKQFNPFLNETHILVKRALARTQNDSVLFTEWKLMDDYLFVPIDSIDQSVFVMELSHDKIAVALQYSEWPSQFTDTTGYLPNTSN